MLPRNEDELLFIGRRRQKCFLVVGKAALVRGKDGMDRGALNFMVGQKILIGARGKLRIRRGKPQGNIWAHVIGRNAAH